MRNRVRYIIKGVIIASVVVLCVYLANLLLINKELYPDDYPATTTFKGFYAMKGDTVDVLFLGSSHGATQFNPQHLYNEYGIRSYNLSSQQQSIFVSYYWLREALRTQNPKVVVMDTFMAFPYDDRDALNMNEAFVRVAIDPMKWSSVKLEAVRDIDDNSDEHDMLSFFMPNIRYHSRWLALGQEDFDFRNWSAHYGLKGFQPFFNARGSEGFGPYKSGSYEGEEDLSPFMREYMDKIVDLCAENGIRLILVKTPTLAFNILRHNSLTEYAASKGVEFWDFNEKELYEESGFVFHDDMEDNGHGNIHGSEKITGLIGKKLSADIESVPVGAALKWEESRNFYESLKSKRSIEYIKDAYKYMETINDPELTVFMAVSDGGRFLADEGMKLMLTTFGIAPAIEEGNAFIAVIHKGDVLCIQDDAPIDHYGSICDKTIDYEIVSNGDEHGNWCQVMIEGEEYSRNVEGLFIVVFDNDSETVIDKVVISEGAELSR